jgi:hypothetical protein
MHIILKKTRSFQGHDYFCISKKKKMKKLTKAFRAFTTIIRNPWVLNHVLDQEAYWKKKVISEFGFSKGLPVIDIEEFIGDQPWVVQPIALLDGGSTIQDLVLLKALASRYKPRQYFEIGTWRGESVSNLAAIVNKCYTLNLPDEKMRQMGLEENYIKAHRQFSAPHENIIHLHADSMNFDFKNFPETCDMVFIDGDHHPEAVQKDSKSVLEIIDTQKSIVIWHDYAANPEKIRWSVLYGIFKGFPEKLHNRLFHVSNTLCAVYLPEPTGSFTTTTLIPKTRATKHFEVSIRIKKNIGKNH